MHISKKKLATNTLEGITDYFLMSIVYARSKKDASVLVNELLGTEERTTLAKRLAIIAMLTHNYSATQIEECLKVSPDTIGRVWRDIKKGRYRHVVRYSHNNKKRFEGESLMDTLEKILTAGGLMPPIGGRNKILERLMRESEYFN
ncbi:hypothetical protein A2841_02065 [Candidatus Kaiserbacteria bacterium RIFCSPHIGHO2_01_FULL_48_10]|uniref:Uncharacterized protein n=1 Tax=Candidatus Kaiserbacteria bacterium RIFCSPHIGHO2_01_FULL_48_10 TaxID=1798476 RepID=A0A1F6C4W6_9BACT|nr:MAG: hypothetical protein A2841_02065 [Candidatus Kaiserbacteria bacterium RIFCSPHIGHO2_01_FULL_48_10]